VLPLWTVHGEIKLFLNEAISFNGLTPHGTLRKRVFAKNNSRASNPHAASNGH
jgi:hypothetical protein